MIWYIGKVWYLLTNEANDQMVCTSEDVYWYIGLLAYWYIGILVYCYIGILVYWYIATLVHWYIGALVYWYQSTEG